MIAVAVSGVDAELDELSPVDGAIDHSFIGWIKDQVDQRRDRRGPQLVVGICHSLAVLDLPAQAIAIGQRDREARLLGEAILHDPLATLIRKRESTDVRATSGC